MAISEMKSSSPLPTLQSKSPCSPLLSFRLGSPTLLLLLLCPGLSAPRTGLPTHIISLSFSMMLNIAKDEGESQWVIENHRISKMCCFFCSGNLEHDVNFPESLSSQLRLRLVIEKAHVSLTDSSSWVWGRGGAGETDRQGSQVRTVTSETPPRRYSP